MSVNLELDLPEELLATLCEDDLASRAREALMMEFLREHRLSQGKAAEMLGVSRDALFSLMTKYRVPAVDLTEAELDEELRKPLPQS